MCALDVTSDSQELACLRSVAKSLALLASQVPAPNYRRNYDSYKDFPWNTIAARIVGKQGEAVVEVEWNGHRFVARRSQVGDKKGKAIWFSRKVSEGWQRLITFKDYENGEDE